MSGFLQRFGLVLFAGTTALLTGCVTPAGYDYTAFRQARPRSILVMPPVNESTDIRGSNSLWSVMSLPLGEAGYYVFPVALVDETFRQNGVTQPAEAASLPLAKLREVFGADAVLYTRITAYGSNYVVISSSTTVTAEARLVDLRTGALLWKGTATANSDEGNNGSGGNIFAMIVVAAIKQVVQQTTDTGHRIAGITAARLLTPAPPTGILYGPHSPSYNNQ